LGEFVGADVVSFMEDDTSNSSIMVSACFFFDLGSCLALSIAASLVALVLVERAAEVAAAVVVADEGAE
jgi:hypothetical protein